MAFFSRSTMLVLSLICIHVSQVFATQSAIFHGTTVAIRPDPEHPGIRNTSFFASNFFSYTAPTGYLSFGWWLPASLSADTSGCIAHPDSFHWYEYSNGSCTMEAGCQFHIKNVPIDDPKDIEAPQLPKEGADYVVVALDLGNPPYGSLALSYIDDQVGGYGVGSRQVLSVREKTADECEAAFSTFSTIVSKYEPYLEFDLVNPCFKASRGSLESIRGVLGNLFRQQKTL